MENVLEAAAELAYNRFTDNHPTIHSNRFPSWKELSDNERQKWRDKVLNDMREF